MIRQIGFFFDRYSTQSDAIIFVSVFLIGLMVQIIFRLWLDFSALFVTLILLCLMTVYANLIRFNTASKTGADRSGDTLYFLGFIFTTITLGIALFKIGESDRDFATSIILSDLGIGISTTVWGLVLRVLFSLMRTGTEEIEGRTLSNLNQKSKSLSAKLTRANQIAEEITIKTQQTLEETGDALAKVASTADERFANIYDETVSKHQALLTMNTAALENLYNKIDAIDVPNDLVYNKVEKSFEILDASLSAFESKIKGIRLSEDYVERKTDEALLPLSNSIRNTADAVNTLQKNIAYFSELDTTSIGSAHDEFMQLNNEVSKLRRELSSQAISPDAFNKIIEEAGEKYKSAVQGLSDKLSAMTVPDKHLLELIDNSFEHYHSFIKDTSQSIVKDSATLKLEITDLKESLSSLSIQASETADVLKKSRASGNIFELFRR